MTRTIRKLICILGLLPCLSINGCAGRPLQISSVNKILTTGESVKNNKKAPAEKFGLQDEIVFYVYVKWEDPLQSYGKHPVVWNWYSNGKLVSTGNKDVNFDKTPKELWTHRSASALGQGHFKVETLVDGKEVGSTEFDIKE
jgi:hypothetical protein